jgi:antagonist of KipI
MSLHVVKPGLLTTVQDRGRFGYQQYGVVAGGAMDTFALQAANALVGNESYAAGLEMTVLGPTLAFEAPLVISLCGADMMPTIGGEPVPLWRPVLVQAGSILRLGTARSGCRCYMAIAGGVDVPPVMNSRSTYLRAGIGGLHGRALQAGDALPVGRAGPVGERLGAMLGRGFGAAAGERGRALSAAAWQVAAHMRPAYSRSPVVRVVEGAQHNLFAASGVDAFTASDYVVQPQSDRMGYRLAGPALALREPVELVSAVVAFGTVQVPPDGRPIVLMADRQTTGGYPQLGCVATADLPLLAQAPIGAAVRFRFVSLQEAQELHMMMQMELEQLRVGVRVRCM